MTHDWKDALSALKESLPSAEGADSSADAPDSAVPAGDTAGGGAAASARTLRIFYEKKGRSGKPATIIEGFDNDDSGALATARALKQRMGCGGSARGGEILLQGDRRQQAAEMLRSMGYKVKGV